MNACEWSIFTTLPIAFLVETRITWNGKVDQTRPKDYLLDRTAFIDCFGQNNQCLTQTFIPRPTVKKQKSHNRTFKIRATMKVTTKTQLILKLIKDSNSKNSNTQSRLNYRWSIQSPWNLFQNLFTLFLEGWQTLPWGNIRTLFFINNPGHRGWNFIANLLRNIVA